MHTRLIPTITALLLCAFSVQAKPEQPNILFIFADDMSYETIGAHGMLDIDTPHLDTLVERGTSFTHAYNMGAYNGAVCIASRAMLNTGRSVWNVYARDTKPQMEAEAKAGHLWSQLMAKAGYRTYMTGKWHVKVSSDKVFSLARHERPGMPHDFWRSGSADGTKPRYYGYFRPKDVEDYQNGWKPWDQSNGGHWEGGTHWSEVVANDAIDFLADAKQQDNPFFMYIAFNASHDPRQSPKEYIDRYPLSRIKLPENFAPKYKYQDEIGCGKGLRDACLSPFPRTEFAMKVQRQEYFALITYMDDQIGRILQALKESGMADNTYIVFTADNGMTIGQHGLMGKQNMYDPSVRVPFMIVGPDVKKGAKSDIPIYLQDAMATALDLADAPTPEYIEFKSLKPLLSGKTDHYDSIYGGYKNLQRMITKGSWKYITYPTCGGEYLYNLKADPQEMNNLATNPEYAAKIKVLRTALLAKSREFNDPLDYNNPVESWKRAAPSKKKKSAH